MTTRNQVKPKTSKLLRPSDRVGQLFVLDLSGNRVLAMNPDGSSKRVIVTDCPHPDGIVVDAEAGLFLPEDPIGTDDRVVQRRIGSDRQGQRGWRGIERLAEADAARFVEDDGFAIQKFSRAADALEGAKARGSQVDANQPGRRHPQ